LLRFVIASTSPDSQDTCKRNVFLYNVALYEALSVMTDGPMVLRTRLRAWFRRWRMYDWWSKIRASADIAIPFRRLLNNDPSGQSFL